MGTTSPCSHGATPAWTPQPTTYAAPARARFRSWSTPPTTRPSTHAAGKIEAELGPIDVWVNDAFTSVFAKFVDIEPEEFRRVTEVSYLGYANGTRAALRRMLPRDRGTIVQVGSTLAYRGIPLQSAYCGAKHAIQGFHESLRTELMHDGSNVHVTMVQMPAVNTPQFGWVLSRLPKRAQPVPPIYQPEVVARAVVYAAAHPQAPGVLGRRDHRSHPARERCRSQVCSTATSHGPASHPSRPTSRAIPNQPENLWHPADDRRRTTAHTEPSTSGPMLDHRRSGPPSTTACWPPSAAPPSQ